ncbi:metal-dependent transcriptional regulator [Peptoniphilus stercorisuis]|uniref:Manganese transport regulator n=1 Tax=Peptoniphilus stercorisuis TaxID=1436965 RepID=A0ABS4KD16_9FIRM|nr:metal-dependent transcriptional regulator [Peptoniphilus stercorisuis]MBP2025674.1 DtxR family Mn-dependent transcriptional regulator [Peptoniphilus stercorisuis]
MSPNREDYIQAIFRLQEEHGFATNKDVADMLKVSRPSVSEMTRKLREDGLVKIERTKIVITQKGIEVAKEVISKHRLWEQFLKEHLDFEIEDAHEQADLLEHVTNDKLKDALNKFLGYPKESPKGNPIYLNEDK